ncbi:MAG: acyl-CoA thioesterase [Armatimonadetes bacterium]|nr:acyl-CoA thioesterase [Armatimonadota bacterium]
MKAIPVSQTRLEMSEVMTPNDANFLGNVFGGRILALLDLVAYATSSRFAGTICVTASFDRVDFHQAVNVGNLVTCIGLITYVGRTSVEVTVEVYAEDVLKRTRQHTNTARVTMVAVDKDGKPTEVPRLICETREDKVRFLEGKLRRELRGVQRQEFEKHAADIRQADESRLDALIEQTSLL